MDARVSANLASPVISSDTFGAGRGGDISIQARAVLGRDGAQISASAHSSGSGGNVSVRAFERVELSGTVPLGARPSIYDRGVVGVPAGGYFGGYLPTGNAENINSTSLTNASFPTGIFTQTTTASSGNAGSITVETPRLIVRDGAAIGNYFWARQRRQHSLKCRRDHPEQWVYFGRCGGRFCWQQWRD